MDIDSNNSQFLLQMTFFCIYQMI